MLLLYPKMVAIHSRCAMIRWKYRGLQDKTLFGFRRDAIINGLPNERFHLRALVKEFEDDLITFGDTYVLKSRPIRSSIDPGSRSKKT